MAVYQFSALSDGQTISFNPDYSQDQLNFDQTSISAADVRLAVEPGGLRIAVISGPAAGKDILLSGVSLGEIGGGNVSFANGSTMQIGDLLPTTVSDGSGNAFSGGAGNDLMMGLGGNDTLNGSSGNDAIAGGTGNDSIGGSGGQDQFVFAEYGAANADVLTDFAGNSWDSIRLDSSAFTAIGAAGRFAFGDVRFYAAAGATGGHDADDRIVYNTTTGQLFYDADGSGPGAAQLIATLSNHAAVRADDMWVFDTVGNQVINGTAGNDSLNGGAGDDTINGLGGSDSISGNAGADVIDGGPGNNILAGGAGADTFAFSAVPNSPANSNFIVDFAPGADRFQLDGSAFSAIGASGRFSTGDERFWASSSGTAHDATDRIIYNTSNGIVTYDGDGNGSGAAVVFANLQGAPTVTAADFTVVNGETGQTINGTDNNDTLAGGPGNDTINGLGGDDSLLGNGGNDFLDGGTGMDTMDGGLGDDTYYNVDGGGGAFSDVLSDAGGIDTVIAVNSSWILDPGFETLILRGSPSNSDWGGSGNSLDNLIINERGSTGSGTAFMSSNGGNDTLIGGSGRDWFTASITNGEHVTVDGGADGGVLAFNANGGVTVDFAAGSVTSAVGSVAFQNIGRVDGTGFGDLMRAGSTGVSQFGRDGDDTLIGGAGSDGLFGDENDEFMGSFVGNDVLSGGGGNDDLRGAFGNDTLNGGSGNDTLTGSFTFGEAHGDSDVFIFDVAPGAANADRVDDFESGIDKIHLDASVMNALGSSGNFTAGDARFWAAAGANAGHDADDRVVFNTSTGELWYDADGSGAGAAQLVATLRPNFGDPSSLAATDIAVDNGGSGGGQLINGTEGSDTLIGGAGNDSINGSGGNDSLVGGAGDDILDGGAGSDTMDGGLGNDTYVLGSESDFLADAGGIDTIMTEGAHALGSAFENIILTGALNSAASGNFLANVMTGNSGSNILKGRDGSDTIDGGAGNDTLYGMAGNDMLTGGAGADAFVFDYAPSASNAKTVTDFASGTDKLDFAAGVHSGIGGTGNFTASDARFFAGAGATGGHDGDDRVIYNTATGALYYDPDGSGAGAAQLVATLQGHPAVSATDIAVI